MARNVQGQDGHAFHLLRLVVDAGEADAIALASELGIRLIADDKQARSVARQMGIDVIGTVGVLITAKQHGLISEVRPILCELEKNEFFIGKPLFDEALRIAGESEPKLRY